jgi:hypothetical protein
MFDAKAFLETYKIPYKTAGKNVARGWVGLRCPFRGCSDDSNHLGWKLSHPFQGSFHCWICGRKAPVPAPLIQALLKIPFKTAEDIAKKFDDDLFPEKTEPRAAQLIKPSGLTETLPTLHRQYLIGRGFDPDFLQAKYGILAGYLSGDFPYRVVVPVYQNKELVNYQGRDVSGQQIKYKAWTNESSLLPLRECLYNIDNLKGNTAVIVEGVFDVWRIGDGAVGTFGTEFTTAQMKNLVFRGQPVERAFVMYDKTAKKQANRLAHFLAPFIKEVEVLSLKDKKDPGVLTDAEAQELRKIIFG